VTGRAALVALAVVAALARPAGADTVTVGVFAPAAPFEGTAARVDFATRLADHVGRALGGRGIGRVYGRAGDFAAAVRRGDVQLAVVDAGYLAVAGGNYTVLAVAVHGGDTAARWQVVSRTGATRVTQLRGKSLLVPTLGGRESDFVLHALLRGELPRGFFARIDGAPDVLSAVAAVGLGKADAAIVPTGVELPPGVSRTATLGAVSWPVLVAYGLGEAQRARAVAAATAFDGGAVLAGFRVAGADVVRELAARYAAPVRRGPMLVPSVGLVAGDLVDDRPLAIERTDVRRFALPVATPAPAR